jgi:hypothetical protein
MKQLEMDTLLMPKICVLTSNSNTNLNSFIPQLKISFQCFSKKVISSQLKVDSIKLSSIMKSMWEENKCKNTLAMK